MRRSVERVAHLLFGWKTSNGESSVTVRGLAEMLGGRLRGRPRNVPGYRVSGTIWPCGDWSYGYARLAQDEPLDARPVEWRSAALPVSKGGCGSDSDHPLDLRNVSNSHKGGEGPGRRGLKGITGYGKKMVKSAGALMKRDPRLARVTFATLTLPEMTEEERRVLVENWAEVVRQLVQWVGRRLRGAGLPRLCVSVTEIQPKRLKRSGAAYLHLHLLWPNHPGRASGWAVDVMELRGFMGRLVGRVLGRGCEVPVNADVKAPKGSVAAYLAKYMSKGGETLAEALRDWGGDCCPRTWWNMSGDMRAMVKQELRKGWEAGVILESLSNAYWDGAIGRWFIWLRHIDLDYGGGLVTVGYRGAVSDAVWADLQQSASPPPDPGG